MSVSYGVCCSVGVGPSGGGRARNEDNFVVCADGQAHLHVDDADQRSPREGEGVLFAVCDGMGGHDDGHVASLSAARILARLYRPGAPREPQRALLKYVRDCHRQLYWRARDRGPVTMGTTLTVGWILDGTLYWLQVGDSSLYLLRDRQLTRLTPAHTRAEFARRDGQLAPEGSDAVALAQSFIYGSRGLGNDTELRLEPGLDTGLESLEAGDVLLACSDGLDGALRPDELARLLAANRDPQRAADLLVQTAVRRGSTDNITALVLPIDEWLATRDALEQWDDEDDERTFAF